MRSLSILIIGMHMTVFTIIDFSQSKDLSNWYVVDDVVMGGRSDGTMELNTENNAVFSGTVSLENNGGFSSIRYRANAIELDSYRRFLIHIRGDGKQYQFRVKSKANNYHSYIYNFETSGKWEVIEIPFDDMYPSFRGRRLDMKNFDGMQIEEMGILIGNKKAESFNLEIEKIEVE